MRNVYSAILMLMMFNTIFSVEQAQSNTNFLQRQYNNFVADMKLITKCYIQQSRACSQQERQEAPMAFARVFGKTAVALIVAVGGFMGIKRLVPYAREYAQEYRKEQPMPQELQANIQAVENVVKRYMPTMLTITWRRPNTLVILVPDHRYITNPIIEPMKQALLAVPGIAVVENLVIQVPRTGVGSLLGPETIAETNIRLISKLYTQKKQ